MEYVAATRIPWMCLEGRGWEPSREHTRAWGVLPLWSGCSPIKSSFCVQYFGNFYWPLCPAQLNISAALHIAKLHLPLWKYVRVRKHSFCQDRRCVQDAFIGRCQEGLAENVFSVLCWQLTKPCPFFSWRGVIHLMNFHVCIHFIHNEIFKV